MLWHITHGHAWSLFWVWNNLCTYKYPIVDQNKIVTVHHKSFKAEKFKIIKVKYFVFCVKCTGDEYILTFTVKGVLQGFSSPPLLFILDWYVIQIRKKVMTLCHLGSNRGQCFQIVGASCRNSPQYCVTRA